MVCDKLPSIQIESTVEPLLNDLKRNHGILCKTTKNDLSVVTFYFTLLTVKGWLKPKSNFELTVLLADKKEVKTIGEAFSGLPNGGCSRLIGVAAK